MLGGPDDPDAITAKGEREKATTFGEAASISKDCMQRQGKKGIEAEEVWKQLCVDA